MKSASSRFKAEDAAHGLPLPGRIIHSSLNAMFRFVLPEFGTEQMEFFMLSAKTGRDVFREKAEHCIKLLHDKYPKQVRRRRHLAVRK